MARERERARAAQRQAATDDKVAKMRHEARRWLVRAILALIPAVALAFVFLSGAVLVFLVAAFCLMRFVRASVDAQRMVEASRG